MLQYSQTSIIKTSVTKGLGISKNELSDARRLAISKYNNIITTEELNEIRRHEIPKNHNTPTNDREFSWDKEQRRVLQAESKQRKDIKNVHRISNSHDGVIHRSDIDSFDYRNLKRGTINKRSSRKK